MNMKEIFLTFAKYNEAANKAIVSILDKLPNDDRERSRKSYYGSLTGLVRHILGGQVYLLGLLKDSVAGNAAAEKALAALAKIPVSDSKAKLTEDQWKALVSGLKAADKACINFVDALEDKDFNAPVAVAWYKGKPPTVPLYFMLQSLVAHGTHHRGQVSQILDSLKIDNDYSGIDAKFLS
ncbi:diguanylate cyclase [Spirochaetia bacterium]|nr:diguanylate cyclase [Spirochaetia bacterium]